MNEGDIEVLVLDDEKIVCERLKDYLQKKGYSVETFTQSSKALERLQEKTFDVVVTDLKMPGPDGISVLVSIKELNVATQVIIITGYPDIESMIAAETKEAFHYITKPFKLPELESLVSKAAQQVRNPQKSVMGKIKDIFVEKPKLRQKL